MITKRYKLINDIGGWLVFAIALVTYWLTLEPTASYWDCGEFIIQADKLEIGHPPGNPIFMLTARFFANFAPDAQHVALMVNAMSGLLSALTILLLFWTISHLVRRLVVKDGQTAEPSLQQYLAIMGSAAVGALAYCWSDTFWFSAVEGEVYAFSSFCTALVFWLILKWENRADDPHSDRYLILIAYIIGISVAVHLLNLLCIPAIVLVFVYRKYKDINVKKSLFALLVSFAIIFFVLYGIVPGIMKVAQQFELFFVNTLLMGFNSGALAYTIVLVAALAWSLVELYRQKDATRIRISFLIATALSGVLFVGQGFWIGFVLLALLAVVLWYVFRRGLPVRVMNVVMWSIAMIFVGYSSYALILIRATADTPMNQNSPDNVFDLASYLNREQYGTVPLFYGHTLNSGVQKRLVTTEEYDYDGVPLVYPVYEGIYDDGKHLYGKGVGEMLPEVNTYSLNSKENDYNKMVASRGGRDRYVIKSHESNPKYNPELNMLFPRIHQQGLAANYELWYNPDDYVVTNLMAVDADGNKVPEYDLSKQESFAASGYGDENYRLVPNLPATAKKPSMAQNLQYFFNYQLNHMYMRYFMWNFAGRQNDILNQNGELDAGNWISGIPFIDNARLGDQSLLPEDLGKGNRGHNVFYMLPLILGILGLLWQAFAGRRGIEQFWVVFFLFFMTGIAIVLYLNQTPVQPRERDYAFAGSFYAFAIWIGMGVAGLWRCLLYFFERKKENNGDYEEEIQLTSIVDEPKAWGPKSRTCAIVACVLGILVPIQMVSQTWDDHDRSGRYAARDFGINYLESLEPNAIVFCNGDNDTFPLWYAQEVEGVRPDVRIINLSYLSSDWYAVQQMMPAYDSAPVPMTATAKDLAYDRLQQIYLDASGAPVDFLPAIKKLYADGAGDMAIPSLSAPFYIPVDKEAVLKKGVVSKKDADKILDRIEPNFYGKQVMNQSELLLLDIVATNAARGWERPLYICSTVGNEFHAGLTPYLRSTGMAQQIVPLSIGTPRTEKAYDVIMKKYRWGGADIKEGDKVPYFDETATRMLSGTRSSILDVAQELMYEGDEMAPGKEATECYRKARNLINLIETRLSERVQPYSYLSLDIATTMIELGDAKRLNDKKLRQRGYQIYENMLVKAVGYMTYNVEMNRRFGSNPSMTPLSSTFSPIGFYHYYLDFVDLGGNPAKVDRALVEHGFDIKQIKQAYDEQAKAYEQGGDDYSNMQDLQMIMAYGDSIKMMEKMTPEQYAAMPEDLRLTDSIFYGLCQSLRIEEYVSEMVNAERSRSLWEQYRKNHPDIDSELNF